MSLCVSRGMAIDTLQTVPPKQVFAVRGGLEISHPLATLAAHPP
jgi:hypothetical protein